MFLASLGLAFSLFSPPRTPVSIDSLLTEMTERESLARLANPAFKQLQASSYDRAQTDPHNKKTWFANADYGQFIRTEHYGERTEWVIMEHQGAGAITRIWTPLLAEKNKMIVRFYFDGSAKPGIEENFNDLLRDRARIKPPFAYIAWPDPGVADGVAGDCYFPIPFAKSCKVTLSEVPFYYSIDYRAYSPGTQVKSFTWADFDAERGKAERAAKLLDFARPDNSPRHTEKNENVAPNRSATLALPSGSNSVTGIELDVPKDIDPQALRSTVIEATFDGEKTVWCPIGDFFGCGIHLRPVSDRYRRVSSGGVMEATWVMPYRRSATLRILNLGPAKLKIRISARTKRWSWDRRSLHFHASWRYQFPLATRPMSDWNYLEATGQGQYVGDTLTVMNPSPAWYGEGDERVYVDGEKFPSQLGTGTEDYYGYAWGMDEHWSSAYMSMPARDHKGRSNWTGFTTTSRVRGLDAIPFDRSLRFDMELWHWADCNVAYAAASFWYARPEASSNRSPSPAAAAKVLPEPTLLVRGAIECESLSVLRKSDAVEVSTQGSGLTEGAWSGGEQLFLQARSVGDFVELNFPVGSTGTRHVVLYATKSYDYGIVRFSINGKPAKDVDLWSEKSVATGPIDLGEFDLTKGMAVLRAEVVGSNPQSTGARCFFGLDCIALK